ncbi:MAG: hypothetical protein ABI158_13685, partial [Edaphobacter sp.]
MPRATLASFTISALFCLLPGLAAAQTAQPAPPSSGTKNAINGIDSYPSPGMVRYAKSNDPESRRIDMFLS